MRPYSDEFGTDECRTNDVRQFPKLLHHWVVNGYVLPDPNQRRLRGQAVQTLGSVRVLRFMGARASRIPCAAPRRFAGAFGGVCTGGCDLASAVCGPAEMPIKIQSSTLSSPNSRACR
jgi:hypothetical protein